MKTFHLENLPFDPAIEAGEDAMRQVEKNSPSERTYDPIEDEMKCHPKLTREKALEMAEEYGF